MKTIKNIFLILIFSSVVFAAQNDLLRIMTYNIRYANNNPGEEWDIRKNNVVEMIRFHKPDIFGLQEALLKQVVFILNELDNYQLVGVGREDGKSEGEFCPLFISKKYSIEDYGTFWLSETPEFPSLGWDASFKRIATWAIIKCPDTNLSIFVLNTHLDHQGQIARKESAKLLMEKTKELNNQFPIVLTGDFNFTSESECYDLIDNYGLVRDSYQISKYKYGSSITFNGFENDLTNKPKIDFIFVSSEIDVEHHAIIGDKFDGQFPSDHMPVIIDISIKK